MTIPRPHNYDNKKYTDKVVDPEMKSILVDKAKNQLSFLINEECHCWEKKKIFTVSDQHMNQMIWKSYHSEFFHYYKQEILHALFFLTKYFIGNFQVLHLPVGFYKRFVKTSFCL